MTTSLGANAAARLPSADDSTRRWRGMPDFGYCSTAVRAVRGSSRRTNREVPMVGAGTGLRKIVAKPASALMAGAMLATFAAAAQARVTKIVIDTQVSPAFDGASFGSA